MLEKFIGKFTIEDVILYLIIIGLLFFIGSYLNTHTNTISRPLTEMHHDSLDVFELKEYQLRYDFASRALLTNTSRINMSFMIGSILTILGGLIIIRRVRKESFRAEGESPDGSKFNLESNSPGLIICLLGAIIICISILAKDKYEIRDSGENPPESDGVQSQVDKNRDLFKDL